MAEAGHPANKGNLITNGIASKQKAPSSDKDTEKEDSVDKEKEEHKHDDALVLPPQDVV